MSSILKVDQLQDSGGNNLVTSNGSGVITAAGFGKVGQVVSTSKTDVFSSTSTGSFIDITGLSLSITPSSTSSKILVIFHINLSTSNLAYTKIRRGTTDIAIGDAASSRIRVTTGHGSYSGDTNRSFTYSATFLDSPSSTSQLDYNIQGYCETSNTTYINRSANDPDSDTGYRMVSSLTLMEIA